MASTYLDFSPETSAVRLSAYLRCAYLEIQYCDPTSCAERGNLRAANRNSRK